MTRIQELLAENERLAKELFAPRADEVDRSRSFPRKNIKELGQSGLLGLTVPVEFGGAGGNIAMRPKHLKPLARLVHQPPW